MARLLLLLALGAGVAWLLRSLVAPRPSGRRARRAERIGGEMVLDPVCGTYIPKSAAVAERHGREMRYFCGRACADAFRR